jgi:hypothetical protein
MRRGRGLGQRSTPPFHQLGISFLAQQDAPDQEFQGCEVIAVRQRFVTLRVGFHPDLRDLPSALDLDKPRRVDAEAGPTPMREQGVVLNEQVPLVIHVTGDMALLNPRPLSRRPHPGGEPTQGLGR